MTTHSPTSQSPCIATPETAPVPVRAPIPAGTGEHFGRKVPEWRGKAPDTKVPDRVRARIFMAHGGICFLTKRKIMLADYWELDHATALINGGEHCESNLVPVLRDAHRIKTRADVAEKSKIARIRKKHLGIKSDRTIRAWRKFDGTIVYARRER